MLSPPSRLIQACLRVATLTGVALILTVVADAQSLPGYQAPLTPKTKDDTPLSIKAARGEVPFRKAYAQLKVSNTKLKRIAKLTKREEKSEAEKLLHVGVLRSLKTPLDPLTDSDIHNISIGVVRVAGLISSGALGVRVQFMNMSLAAGARVFVYSMSNPDEYYGPYEGHGVTQDGTFWTPPVTGEGIVIEYFEPSGTKSTDVPFKVAEIAHIYSNVSNTQAGACNLEVSPEWANVAKSVAMLQFITGPYVALCTGTLLNDSNPNLDHYVLTANHCISTQSEAQSTVAYWNYDSGETPPNGTASNGFELVVTGSPSDFTLLRRSAVPSGLFFSGWDASSLGTGTSVTGIHHPKGSHKRIAFGTTNADCLFSPCADFAGVTWSQGTTEPGSSGSGLWAGTPDNAKLVGTLTGGQSSCDNLSGTSYYGRFSLTYPAISSYLQGTNCVTSISPANQSFTEVGGTGSITITAAAGCNWTAVPIGDFISITGNANGSGNGSISFAIAANKGPQRSGSIVVGGQVFKIFQTGGGPCAATPIGFGQTINGNLSTNGCPLGDGTYYDVYSFNALAGQRISVSMSSSAFDAYLFLNKPDGTNLYQDDDGGGGSTARIPSGTGFVTLPESGTYTLWANAFSPQQTSGAYSITLSEQPRQTLTVQSAGVSTPVNVTLFFPDLNGNTNGVTPFTRVYYQTTNLSLSVPAVVDGMFFKEWQKDGVALSTNTIVGVAMDTDHTMTAVYRPPRHFSITVESANSGGGAQVKASDIDDNGLGDGTTPFTRTYTERSTGNFVNFTALSLAPNGNVFQKWQRNGVDVTTSTTVGVTLDANYTVTAFYVTAPTAKLTVNSSNPDSGVSISADTDLAGLGSGTTPFARTYMQNTNVNLMAPATANGNFFEKWIAANGSTLSTGQFLSVPLSVSTTVTAVYVPVALRTLTVQSLHPNAGVNIVVTPNDNSGAGNGTTPFTRTYVLNTNVTVSAPAVVGQNTFLWWTLGTHVVSQNLSFSISMEFNGTLTAVYLPGPPVVWTESGTNNLAAINSVTYLRGPFQILDSHNFSADGHTRIIMFTSDLELSPQQNPDPAVISVQAGGVNLPVENVGSITGPNGMNGSYLVVKLPDGLPGGNLSLTITLRGLTSTATTLPVWP